MIMLSGIVEKSFYTDLAYNKGKGNVRSKI